MNARSCFIGAIIGVALSSCGTPSVSEPTSSVEDVTRFFRSQGREVVTFVGYSGSGYEDEARMIASAREVLRNRKPGNTIINIGATPEGIGAVYPIAKEMGFTTTGIVSTQARKYESTVSPHVDHVFFVEDAQWGGMIEDTGLLSPTSQAMVEVSDVLIGIGGGEVGRDELVAARKLGKRVRFVPADMNHQRAIQKAAKKGRPSPTDFRGSAHTAFMP